MWDEFKIFLRGYRDGMSSRFSCVATGIRRLSLDFEQAVKNLVGCASVWNW